MAKKSIIYRYFLKNPVDTTIDADTVKAEGDSLVAGLSGVRKSVQIEKKEEHVTLFSANRDSVLKNHQEYVILTTGKGSVAREKYRGEEKSLLLIDSVVTQGIFLFCFCLTVYSIVVGRKFYDYCLRFLNFNERFSLALGGRGHEVEAKSALFLQSIIIKGLLSYLVMRIVYLDSGPGQRDYMIFLFVGIFLLYYLVKVLIFYVLGVLFYTVRDLNVFFSGYFSLLSIEGLLLFAPLVALVFFAISKWVVFVWVGLIVLFVTIMLIMSGLKIFFKNYRGFFYILLYLCALEVYPAIVLFQVLSYSYLNF